jgi:hypothetical protein
MRLFGTKALLLSELFGWQAAQTKSNQIRPLSKREIACGGFLARVLDRGVAAAFLRGMNMNGSCLVL